MRFAFVDFWPTFDWSDFYVFNEIIPELCEVEIVEENPDILFFSVFGNDYKKYKCPKIFFSAENRQDTYERIKSADLSFSHHVHQSLVDDTHYKLPHWLIKYGLDTAKELTQEKKFKEKKKFCSFLYSNSQPQKRKKFFKELSRYKTVDSGGSVLNNLGAQIPYGQEINWKSQYKFSIDFENQAVRGYTTEKIVSTFLADTVPIYWGNPDIGKNFNEEAFNEKAFIHIRDFPDFEKVISYIKKIDQDEELYRKIQTAPALKRIPDGWKKSNIKERLKGVIDII